MLSTENLYIVHKYVDNSKYMGITCEVFIYHLRIICECFTDISKGISSLQLIPLEIDRYS